MAPVSSTNYEDNTKENQINFKEVITYPNGDQYNGEI